MTIELYDRRKRMLELYYSGMQEHKIVTFLTEDGYSIKALRQDWYRRKEWEPFIWRTEQSKEDVDRLLFQLRLGREKLLRLATIADNDNAKVGACGRLADNIRLEIELRQSLGLLQKAADKLEIDGKIKAQQFEELDAQAIIAIAENLADKKIRELRQASADPIQESEDSS